MNKMARTENIIINYLEDKKWHSISEIKSKIMDIDHTLLENDNFIYVVLNDLKVKKGLIEHGQKGMYRKNLNVKKEVSREELIADTKDRSKFLKGWRKFYSNTINKYQVSLDMSEDEFRKAKWLHELNKEVEHLIINYSLESNQNHSSDTSHPTN